MDEATSSPDDLTISATCGLLRRINSIWVVPDQNSGGLRISSAAFKDKRMSIHLGDDLIAAGHPLEIVVERYPTYGLASVRASTARTHAQRVVRDHDESQLFHGLVIGSKPQSVARSFAAEATANWIVRR